MLYKCPTCPEKFAKRSLLERHILTHTGERPFVCDICASTFYRKDHLTRHRHVHTRTFKWKCTVPGCSYATNESSHWKRHEASCRARYNKNHMEVSNMEFEVISLPTSTRIPEEKLSNETVDCNVDDKKATLSQAESDHIFFSPLSSKIRPSEHNPGLIFPLSSVSQEKFEDQVINSLKNEEDFPHLTDLINKSRSRRNSITRRSFDVPVAPLLRDEFDTMSQSLSLTPSLAALPDDPVFFSGVFTSLDAVEKHTKGETQAQYHSTYHKTSLSSRHSHQVSQEPEGSTHLITETEPYFDLDLIMDPNMDLDLDTYMRDMDGFLLFPSLTPDAAEAVRLSRLHSSDREAQSLLNNVPGLREVLLYECPFFGCGYRGSVKRDIRHHLMSEHSGSAPTPLDSLKATHLDSGNDPVPLVTHSVSSGRSSIGLGSTSRACAELDSSTPAAPTHTSSSFIRAVCSNCRELLHVHWKALLEHSAVCGRVLVPVVGGEYDGTPDTSALGKRGRSHS